MCSGLIIIDINHDQINCQLFKENLVYLHCRMESFGGFVPPFYPCRPFVFVSVYVHYQSKEFVCVCNREPYGDSRGCGQSSEHAWADDTPVTSHTVNILGLSKLIKVNQNYL